MSSWVYIVQVIANGESVEQVVVNRPINQLISRTDYLFEQLQRVAGGEMIAALNQTLGSTTVPGTPVYYDRVNDRFAPALNEADLSDDAYGQPTERAFVAGIVLNKHTQTTGDVALFGKIDNEIYDIDWSTVADDGQTPIGRVNLSSAEAGKIGQVDSHLTVRLGSIDANGDFYFQPRTEGSLRDHLHYRFSLEQSLGAVITDQGWLPAAVYTGNGISVPAGMTHGYNVPQDSGLAQAFPPSPRAANALYIDGLLISEGAYVIGDQYLWVDSGALATTPWSAATELFMALLVGDNGSVSSLGPNTDIIPLTITNSGGDPDTTGSLLLGVRPSDAIGGDTSEAPYALKEGLNGRLERGPVVTRFVPGQNVSLSGEAGDADDGFFGRVQISVGTDGSAVIQPTLVALDNAVEDFYGEIPSLAFPKNRSSSLRYAVALPSNLVPGRAVRLRIMFLAGQAVSDVLNFEVLRLQPGAAVPTAYTNLAGINPGVTAADTPVEVVTASVNAEPGDVLYFRITQPLASPSYDLFVPRVLASIVAGS